MNPQEEAAMKVAGAVELMLKLRGTESDTALLDRLFAAYDRYGRPGAADWTPLSGPSEADQ